MRGDLTVRIAYGAPWSITVTYKDSNGTAIDVTGYTGELRLATYNGGGEFEGDPYGTTVLALSCTVGGVNGQFSRSVTDVQTLALSSTFGSPVATRLGRWSLWVTPPATTAFPIAYGWVDYRPVGEAVSATSEDFYEASFSANVSAFGSRGPTGATGAQGPPGTGTEPTDGSVTTSSTTTTTLQTIDLSDYLNKNWRVIVETTAKTASATNTWVQSIVGFTSSLGVTTHEEPVNIEANTVPRLGTPIFENGSASLLHRAKAASSTSTTWSRSARIVQTWS